MSKFSSTARSRLGDRHYHHAGRRLVDPALPVEQSRRSPAAVSISALSGASAKIVEDSVTQVIEQKMTGLDHLRYMASSSDSTGNVNITLTFEPEADPDIAQVQVQNKLQLATPLLPQDVQQRGLTVTKSTNDFLMVIGFVSKDGSMSQDDIADYLAANLQETLSRVTGVGDVQLFGLPKAMRIWLDPDKQSRQMTVTDVLSAIETEIVRFRPANSAALHRCRASSSRRHPRPTRMQTAEEFDNILRASIRTARRCACATSRASRSVRNATSSSSATTARPPPGSASSWRPAPMRWRPLMPSRRRLPNSPPSSPRGWNSPIPTIRPPT
jgi:hypothetical protein